MFYKKSSRHRLPEVIVDISGGDTDKFCDRIKAVKRISKKTKQKIHVLCFDKDFKKTQRALRGCKNIIVVLLSSYQEMFEYYNNIENDCTFVSAGDTREIVVNSCRKLGKSNKKTRPVLTGTFPTAKGLIAYGDLGANAKEKLTEKETIWIGLILKKFIEKSSCIKNKEKIKIGLQNIGEEEGKGGIQKEKNRKALEEYFKNSEFYGNVEFHQINRGIVNGLIANAIEANNCIKAFAGTQNAMLMKTERGSLSFITKIAFKILYALCWQDLDWRRYSGAYLLGVKKSVIITHGRSDETAFFHAIKRAMDPETITIFKYINNSREIFMFK